jgi:hypothetical protein
MAKVTQHEDFGEKIGGAKKDLWTKRGLYSSDLEAMNNREADKYVKKDNVWKKPDYQAMIDGGMPAPVAYFIKKVRDSTNTAPEYLRSDDTPEKRLDRQKEYIDAVRELQGIVEAVKTKEDAKAVFEKFFLSGGYVEKQTGRIGGAQYTATEKGRDNPVITNKLFKMMHIRSDSAFEYDFTRKAKREQFGVPKDDKIPKGYGIHFHDGKNSYSKHDDWKVNTYFVTKGSRILQANLETKSDAVKWVQDLAKSRGAEGKQRLVPPQLEHIRRNGPDYRQGQNMDGKDYLDTFSFKGGEFGNWMSQTDRQASLNYGFEALKDLSRALSVTDKDISYGGKLSIAFGARGSGNAMAHYEPMRQVINLTKMRGAGSLAHEWWHGLDDFLGKKYGANTLLSETQHKHPLFSKLIDTIKYKPATPEQAAASAQASDARTLRNAESWLKSIVEPYINKGGDEALAAYTPLKEAFLRGESGSTDKMSALKKSIVERVIPKEDRERLVMFENIIGSMANRTEPTIGKVQTDYLKNSIEIGKQYDKDGGYWDSNVELTARAFATYITDKLPERSDYLIGHAESAVGLVFDKDGNPSIVKAFPEGAEREAINAVFDEIITELKRENILTHEDKAAELSALKTAKPDISDRAADFVPIPGEQLTLSDMSKTARPSVLDKLAAAKDEAAKGGSGKPEKNVKPPQNEL